jgi:PAS domain S-box-containing protein
MTHKATYEELEESVRELQRQVRNMKKTRDAVREERDFFKTVFALAPDLLVMKDRNGVYRAVNPAFCRFLAMPEQKIIGRTDFDLFPRPEAETCRNDDEKVMETGKPRVQVRATVRGAEKKWLQVSKTPIFDETGTCLGVLSLVRDITQHRKAEEDLKKREADLFRVNKELLDTNRALSVLAANIEKNWKEMERGIGLTISSKVMPMVDLLRQDKGLRHRAELDMLATYVNNLTSGLANGMVVATSLSSTELRIAAMVKNGLTSQEIARQLNVSLHTVKTHRKHIRKKLKIQNSGINLSTYLKSKMP